MGAWGQGIFENTLAAEVRDGIIAPLKSSVESYFTNLPNQMDVITFEEELDGDILPRIAMILALCDSCQGTPPSLTDVRHWHEKYLTLFNNLKSGSEERKRIVESIFEQLEQLASQFGQN
jgi:hypothetical protein